MSAQELIFNVDSREITIKFSDNKLDIAIYYNEYEAIKLDRNQAHLLFLYLQEHLGYNKTEIKQ